MANAFLNGPPETLISVNRRLVTSGGARGIYLPTLDRRRPAAPELTQLEDNEFYVANGAMFTWQPAHRYRVTTGHYRKSYGPDCVSVNPITGQVKFNTALMPLAKGYRQDQTVHIGVELSNVSGISETVIVLHIGKLAANIHRVGPTRTYTTLNALAVSGVFQPGDTVVIDQGVYTGVNNTLVFREGALGTQLPGGTNQRYTNIIGRVPGEWVFDGEGVNLSAIYIYGNEASADWDNTWVGSVNRNWTMISGLKTIRCKADSIGGAFCSYVVVRNCWPGDACAYGGDGSHNVSNIDWHRCHDILVEESFVYGYGRYNFSSYESNQVVYRRCSARWTPYWGRQPASSGFSFYRARYCTAQNCWVLDCQLDPSWKPRMGSPQYTTDAFQIASTGVYAFSHSNEFNRCGAIGIDTGFLHAASYGLTPTQWAYTAREFFGMDAVFNHGKDSEHGIMTGYKARMYNSTVMRARWPAGTNSAGAIIQGDQKQIYDSLFHDIGLDETGVLQSTTPFFAHWANDSGRVHFERSSLSNFAGPKLSTVAAGYPATLVEVSPLTILGTRENGLQYPGRIEPGSALDVAGIGAKNTLKNWGKLGTYYGDPEFDVDAGTLTFPLVGEAVTQRMYNEYTYNEPLSGLPIFRGNYGIGAAGENISYWAHSRIRDSVFPLHVAAQEFDDAGTPKVRVSWLRHPDKYKGKYLGFKVYRNAESSPFAIVTGEETDAVDPAPIAIGTDVYTVVAMHHGDSDSGHSHPVTAMAA